MSQTLRPTSMVAPGNWQDDFENFVDDLSDSSDSTYVYAQDTGELILSLAAGSTPAAGARTLTVKAKDDSGVEVLGALTIKIYQGAVEVQTFTVGAGVLTGSFVNQNNTVTNAITDYTDVRVGLAIGGTWADPANCQVSEVSFSIPDAPTGSVLAAAARGGFSELSGGMG